MNKFKYLLPILLTLIILPLSMMNAHANTASPKPPLGSLKGNALTLAIPYILKGVGWVMEEGTKVNKTTPTDGTSGTGTNTGTDTGTRPINEHGDYPHEFLFDGQSFSSASAAHEYIITTYIHKKGLIRTRRESDGLEYDKLDVYYGRNNIFSSGVGVFSSCVQVAHASNPPKNMIGGSLQCWHGQIFYKGRLSESNTNTSQDYKDRRDQAKTALEQAIAEAASYNEQAVNEAIEALNGMKADTRYDSAAIDAIIAQLTGFNAKPISTPTTGTGTQTGATTGTTEGANTDANTNTQDTTKPQTKPVADSKPFELPGFCKWASWFCDDNTKPDQNTEIEIDDSPIDFIPLAERSYINLPRTCPANPIISFEMPFVSGSQRLEFPMDKFCEGFAMFKIVVILFGYIRALTIVGEGL